MEKILGIGKMGEISEMNDEFWLNAFCFYPIYMTNKRRIYWQRDDSCGKHGTSANGTETASQMIQQKCLFPAFNIGASTE